ncbi:HprK-related kinase A [Aquisalimonas asiatica]|uniref:HprK-related kinase A n=1 Tax=Aquisalimonas asiatica TaxID=406100 RepID=A0A1H8U534_9GAMM|nr:HprK-related kinase A [Aquisalimonas asiatica]SEO98349.1 hypothetical protein SAMN04488052_105188 [Aquisalimonas asiatica]
MRVAELGGDGVRRALSGCGLSLVTGGLTTRIRTRISGVAESLEQLYAAFPVAPDDGFADFHCTLRAPRTLRRWYRPQVLFLADGRSVFKPLAFHQAFPMLEWGMNWCIGTQLRHQLVLHAASLERNGRALIMPAPPMSGKSTLTAALANSGWRLLTDESTLVDLAGGRVSGPARPVSLKNASIDVIRSFAPAAHLSEPCHDTLKGTVAHMRPPDDSVHRAGEPAQPAWVVFPRFEPGASTRLVRKPAGEAFLQVAANAFNYPALGRIGFHALADLMEQVETYEFVYSRLEEAIEVFHGLRS